MPIVIMKTKINGKEKGRQTLGREVEVMHAWRIWTIYAQNIKLLHEDKELKMEERYKQSYETEKDSL